nr:ribonuclease H-like domain-containing protein [Tanacetum cinerariifolium]
MLTDGVYWLVFLFLTIVDYEMGFVINYASLVIITFLYIASFSIMNSLYAEARLVANSSSQQLGADFDETFSPVVKSATIRTVLSLALS